MSRKFLLWLSAVTLSAPLAAQQTTPPPSDVQPTSGLVGSVSDESEWQDLGIAIPGFATDRDVATPAGQSKYRYIEAFQPDFDPAR